MKIELPGTGRTLTLAEVEVFSGGANIAKGGKAHQSSTASGGLAEKAIDGNKNPAYGGGGQTHTNEGSNNPWWELDLGRAVPIDQVSVWNRNEGNLGDRLDDFTLTLLDSNKKKITSVEGIQAPDSSVEINFKKEGEVSYRSASGKIQVIKNIVVPDGYRDPSPFRFEKGDTVAIVGNGLADRMQHDGWTETLIQAGAPTMGLVFRNMSLTGDRVNKYPRSSGFTKMNDYLTEVGADVVIAMFGYNESFEDEPQNYAKELAKFVDITRKVQPNGKSFPRIVLCSPIAHENLSDRNLPSGRANNQRLLEITEATRNVAQQKGVAFIDLFHT